MKDGVWLTSVGDFADDEDELKNTFKTEVRVMLRQMIQMAHMLHRQVMKGVLSRAGRPQWICRW